MVHKKSPNLEQALSELEALVENLERGDLTLEDSLKAFELGVRLTRQCQDTLSAAEQKIQVLIEQNGDLHADAFSADE